MMRRVIHLPNMSVELVCVVGCNEERGPVVTMIQHTNATKDGQMDGAMQ